MNKGIHRRDFFKIAAASGATAAITSCNNDPVEKLIPALLPPSDYVPGKSVNYATTCQECTSQCGTIVRTREGRAIKVEGNPKNPLNKGGLCGIGQASLQGLYNPARARGPQKGKEKKEAISWEDGKKVFQEKLTKIQGSAQEKRLLYIGRANSGTFRTLIHSFLQGVGGDQLLFNMSPLSSLKQANQEAFGREEIPEYKIDQARVLVNFGADFLETWLNPIENTKKYTAMHAYQNGTKGKYIHISPHLSLTGTNADEWVTCKPGQETQIALSIAYQLLSSATHLTLDERNELKSYLAPYQPSNLSSTTGISQGKIETIASEMGTRGNSLALSGGNAASNKHSKSLHLAVNILNYVAGNIGKTVSFGADYRLSGDSMLSVKNTIAKMNSGQYDIVVIHDVNPVYSLPPTSGFKEALSKVDFVVSLSSMNDETSAMAHLHLPTANPMESWGDSNPRKGIYGLQQPVMSNVPMFDTRQSGDLLLELGRNIGLTGFDEKDYQAYLKNVWKEIQKEVGDSSPFPTFWKKSLQNGGVFREYNPQKVSFSLNSLKEIRIDSPSPLGAGSLNLLALNSPFHNTSGEGATKPWLLEIPHPVTQLVWGSWVEMHPETAEALGLKQDDEVEVSNSAGRTIKAPVWIYHGIDKGSIAMPTGLGRTIRMPSYSSKRVSILIPTIEDDAKVLRATKVGVNVIDLLGFQPDIESSDLSFSTQVTIKPTKKKGFSVRADGQYRDSLYDRNELRSESKVGIGDRSQKGRGFAQTITLNDLKHGGHDGDHGGHHLKTRYYTVKGRTESTHSFYRKMEETVKIHPLGLKGNDTPKYYDPYRWGMSIDLDRCTGCSACVVSCYAENNIPVVGKERFMEGRDMSWIRIERYFDHEKHKQGKGTGKIETLYSPAMCNQCGNAGCEAVCPVYATYHNPEGLNAMVYNRCVGTRYCSNNCIYKQRRFNWRTYEFPPPLNMQLNPAVSVRSKGVMEKCTFCVHRIREKKELAKDQGRQVRDGEIKTACQQSCPTNAITFGNLQDSNSKLSTGIRESKRGYKQLEEIAFKPATTYFKKVKL